MKQRDWKIGDEAWIPERKSPVLGSGYTGEVVIANVFPESGLVRAQLAGDAGFYNTTGYAYLSGDDLRDPPPKEAPKMVMVMTLEHDPEPSPVLEDAEDEREQMGFSF